MSRGAGVLPPRQPGQEGGGSPRGIQLPWGLCCQPGALWPPRGWIWPGRAPGNPCGMFSTRRGRVPLAFSDSTVLRLPSGASSRAKQSGWMLMPMSDTMQGCCRACSMLASCRNSEKFFMASVARRCLSMVSAGESEAVCAARGAPLGPLGCGSCHTQSCPMGARGAGGQH